jgi:hypothetical protein
VQERQRLDPVLGDVQPIGDLALLHGDAGEQDIVGVVLHQQDLDERGGAGLAHGPRLKHQGNTWESRRL